LPWFLDRSRQSLKAAKPIAIMSEKKNAYGSKTNDTSFRRTWDKEEYEQRAKEADTKRREEGKARYEAKLAGKKYFRRASTPPDARQTEARKQRLDVGSQVGKISLVPAGAAVGKRGRGAGFYCEACDLTFKDNLQLVEHYNSKQHLAATGETGEVKVATLQEVRERLRWLKRKREEERREDAMDLETKIKLRTEQEEKEREEKRRRRNEKRRAKKEDSD